MNIDFSASFAFGNEQALRSFLLDHAVVHEQTAAALTQRYGGGYSTAGLLSNMAEDAWVEQMRLRRGRPAKALVDWLQIHYYVHNITYQRIGGTGTNAPDISEADFTKPALFYDWMLTHQSMHDFEQQALGLK
jgi:hypothetical protein